MLVWTTAKIKNCGDHRGSAMVSPARLRSLASSLRSGAGARKYLVSRIGPGSSSKSFRFTGWLFNRWKPGKAILVTFSQGSHELSWVMRTEKGCSDQILPHFAAMTCLKPWFWMTPYLNYFNPWNHGKNIFLLMNFTSQYLRYTLWCLC